MSSDNTSPTFGELMGNFLRFMLRLLFILVIAIGLGVAIYFGAAYGFPELYRRYVQPVEDNSMRLENIESAQKQDIQQLNERIEAISSRLT